MTCTCHRDGTCKCADLPMVEHMENGHPVYRCAGCLATEEHCACGCTCTTEGRRDMPKG